MTPDSPLRAQADSRLTDADSQNMQASLFDGDRFTSSTFDSRDNSSLLNDYRQRYGLSEDPFSDDPSFPLFTGGGRRQLLDQLLHLCQFSQHLLVITGEHGVGKTRIAHALADSLEENDQLCFLALSPSQTLEQLLVAMAESFSLEMPSPISVDTLLVEIEKFINDHIANSQESGTEGLVLLIIDNAEHLDSQSVAVLASLIEGKPPENPLHIVLVGEPRLVSRLNGLESESLQISDFHLPAFSLSEVVDYLNFRMEMADYLGPEIFSETIVDPWWRQAHGQLTLIHESAQDKLLQSVTPQQEAIRSGLPIFHILAISAVIAVAGVFYLYLDDDKPTANLKAVVPVKALDVVSHSSVSSVSASLALTTTQTPVNPILPSLADSSIDTLKAQVSEETVVNQLAASSAANVIAELQPSDIMASNEAASAAIDKTLENNPPAASSKNISHLTEPVPVKGTAISGNYTTQEQQILAWSPTQFTIQLLGVSSLKSAKDFVSAQSNKTELLIFKTKRSGKDWFVVVTGHYQSNAQARAAIPQLPLQQREAGPWPRQIKVIQDEIRQ